MSEIDDSRRKSIQKSIRPIGAEDMKALEGELFPYHDNPWRERFSEFVKANPGATFFHATTHDGIHILYCHSKEKGIWFVPGSGLGPLQEKGLTMMKRIVEKI